MNLITWPYFRPDFLEQQGLSPNFLKRFWKKVQFSGPIPKPNPELGPCWIWTGATVSGGYGHIRCSRDQTKTIRANRASWILHFGAIPHGHDVLHKCDFPRCVNPNHLFTGTAKDNALDAAKKGRMARGESSGTSKLNSEMIFEIRELYASGKHSQAEIASAFRCGQMTISDIIRRKTWSHI